MGFIPSIHYFNSTMVRLKDQDRKSHCDEDFNFNSTMVRLKADSSNNVYYYDIRFQFHYGTIKRMMNLTLLMRIYLNFNSTMVRLKGISIKLSWIVPRFQFHYGTIKRIGKWYESKRLQVFQFHYGTIKREMQTHLITPDEDFNSTMVRLKVVCFSPSMAVLTYFNSTMVRLKATEDGSSTDGHQYFNSTMVRLKALML